MKKKVCVVLVVGLLCLVGSISTGIKTDENDFEIKQDKIFKDQYYKNYEEYSVMQISPEYIKRHEEEYRNSERAYIDPDLMEEIQATERYSILDLLEYVPSERNQGRCGNCWAWPSTAILAMALNIQEGIKDRLSVQFINTCGEEYTGGMNSIECCGGGTLEMFANFYKYTNFAIPWTNTMAHWHDGVKNNCKTDCNEISKTPYYPIYDIDSVVIPTRSVTTEEAIENIKNVLHQQKGVYFSIMYPDLEDLRNFQDMWSDDAEDESYDLDYYCGNEWNEEEAVGHALLIVGYNDVEGTENDYWIVLNSWGTTDKRPNGLIAWDMHMDYDCKYSNYNAFAAKTLNVIFKPDPNAPEKPTIVGPSSGEPDKEYTFELSANDPQGDNVSIYIKWDSGLIGSGWLGPVNSGEVIQVSHTWDESETYIIRAKARDTNNNVSEWTSFEINLPKTKSFKHPIINFLENHPYLFPQLLQLLLRTN